MRSRREGWRSKRRRGNQRFMYAIKTENVARKDEERSFLAQRSGTTRFSSSPPLALLLRAASSSSRPRSCKGNRKTDPSCLPAPPHTVSCPSSYPVSALANSPPDASYLPGEVEAAGAPIDLFVIVASGSLLLDGDCWEAGSLDLLLALLRSENRRGRTACTLE
jgi:hypothetical protein